MDDFGFVPDTNAADDFGFVADEAPAAPKARPRKDENYGNEGRRTPQPAETALDTTGRKSLGLVEAGMGTVAGLPSMIAGGVYGLGALTSGMGLDEANRRLKAAQEWNFGMGEYKPSTETGKKYLEKAGEVMAKPGELAGEGAYALGMGELGRTNAEVAVNTLMNFAPLPVGVKGMRKTANTVSEALRNKPESKNVATNVDDFIKSKKAQEADIQDLQTTTKQLEGQGDLFGFENTEGMASQYNPNQAVEPIAPLRQRRQMDLPMGEPGAGPMTQTADGILNHPANAELFKARDMREELLRQQLDAEQRARAPGQLFPEDPYQGSVLDQGPQLPEQAPVAPARGGLSDRRQMDLGLGAEQPLTASPQGILRGTEDPHAALAQSQYRANLEAQIEQARLAGETDKAARMQQMLIDDTQHVLPDSGQLYADQYGAAQGMGRFDENGMPIRADLSMEAQNLQNPLQRNLWGDELGPALGQTKSLTEAIDSMPTSPFRNDARDMALARFRERGVASEDLAKAVANATRWFTASPEHGRTKGYTLQEQAARQNANEQRYGPGQYIAENPNFSSVYGGPDGRMYEVGTTEAPPFTKPFDINQPGRQKTYDTLVKMKGSKAEANKALQAAGYDAITFTSPRGDKLATIFNEAPLTDIGPAREKAKAIALEDLALTEYNPGQERTGLYKKQGGVLWMGKPKEPVANVLKGLDAFKHNMRNIMPEKLTSAEFIEKYKGTKDIVQNAVQKAFNQLSKGGIYMAERVDHPLYSRTVDEFLGAEGRAKAAFNEYVNEDYAPKARKLNKQEFTDTWAVLKKLEGAGVRATPAELAAMGLNEKQRAMVDSHWNLVDNIFPKINETMERLGMDPISPQAAYVASKATGTFRKLIYKDDKVVGIVGDDSRARMNKQVEAYLAKNPSYKAGPEMAMGSKGKPGLNEGFQDTLNWLSANDPDVAAFLQHSKEVMDEAAFKYRGAQTHTMAKKGIEGMAGNKPWEDAYTNAKEGFEAQVAYARRMFEWAEKAKAVENTRDLINSPELDMPKAKEMAQDYMDSSLGKNPTLVGGAIDDVLQKALVASGGKTRYGGKAATAAREFVYTKFLKADLGFLVTQLLQMPAVVPEMNMFLNARGAEGSMLPGLLKALDSNNPITKEGKQWARDNHVYAPDLVGHSDSVRRDAKHVWNSATNYGAAKIESATRQAMFLAMVHKLHESGVKPADGLYPTAQRLTDMGMGNYSGAEAPRIYQQFGAVGQLPYTLSTFKHNELSRLAMLTREVGKGKAAPLLTAVAMQVAKGGVLGTIFYKEAEWLVEQITGMMGEPVNLTKLLLDNADKKLVGPVSVKDAAYGLPGAANVDLTTRMGMGEIAPSGVDAIMPGMSALGQGITDIADYAKDPSVFNAKKAAVDILPGGRHLEGFFFDKPIEGTDKTMGLNRNKVTATVERTPAESRMKKFGFTSVNESKEKSLVFQNQKQDKFYEDKVLSALESMKKDLYENGTVDQKYIDKLVKYQGDPNTLNAQIDKWAQEQNIPMAKRDTIKAAVGNSPATAGRMKRRFQ